LRTEGLDEGTEDRPIEAIEQDYKRLGKRSTVLRAELGARGQTERHVRAGLEVAREMQYMRTESRTGA
jgi:hypothetical protein